jgi:prophage maintenance system killer protein
MNRKKKIIELHKNKLKNPEKRLQNSKKEKYISKAERAKLAFEADNVTDSKVTDNTRSEQ